ncbi:CAP domain-containing protein [Parapedobacter deserti]|uniref:CAP domain-containing protein n=1 Tax=Parapedobacter deserti TaxID=1912957 RepID=A0ABV7JRG6_9SPHI
MLKHSVLAVFCSFALLSACEPNANESMEPVPRDPPGAVHQEGGKKEDQSGGGEPAESDSTIIIALSEINTWRQAGCDCGDEAKPAAEKVTWNAKLYAAALAHAKDMNTKSYFSHTSLSGENVYHRLVQSGYISGTSSVLAYGENIAFGNFDLKGAVQKWLGSPSHCANIMRNSYREMAIAHDGKYWVQVFGTRRDSK